MASSHPITGVRVTPPHGLVVSFEGIELPGQVVDSAGSHGYVVFRVSPMPGLVDGTTFENEADRGCRVLRGQEVSEDELGTTSVARCRESCARTARYQRGCTLRDPSTPCNHERALSLYQVALSESHRRTPATTRTWERRFLCVQEQ